jgi:hypothetical protein
MDFDDLIRALPPPPNRLGKTDRDFDRAISALTEAIRLAPPQKFRSALSLLCGFSLFDQQTCPLYGCLGFRRGIPFGLHDWCYDRDLQLDLLATQRRPAARSIWPMIG